MEDKTIHEEIYREALCCYFSEHHSDPDHVAKRNELLKRYREEPYDQSIIDNQIYPTDIIEHVSFCERCVSAIYRHLASEVVCEGARNLLIYISKMP